ncbi:MAG: TatD family nuclease-associated radical SAM protein [Ketobacteraceae bacterium]|nr:TatD family nuclease-associated radical SAM protein [Ketobacteraceae bacterium]
MTNEIQQPAEPTLVYDIGSNRYINLTNACTLKCAFCPKHNGSWEVKGHELALDFNPRAEAIIPALGNLDNVAEVVFCGFGESTLRLEELLRVARFARSQGCRVRLNTDGLGNLVHKRNIVPELAACVDAVSVSLNAQNESLYNRHCRPTLSGSFQACLDFIAEAAATMEDVTVTAIEGLDGVNIAACEKLATERGAKFRKRILNEVG